MLLNCLYFSPGVRLASPIVSSHFLSLQPPPSGEASLRRSRRRLGLSFASSPLSLSRPRSARCPSSLMTLIFTPLMAVVASAPGKVLHTGGYLILDRPNAGLVLNTNARFFAIFKPLYDPLKPDSWAWGWIDVKLTSPQLSRESLYKLSLKNLTLQNVSSSDSRNPFVEQAVQYCLAAARATLDKEKKDLLEKLLLQGVDITILGSNDLYASRNYIEVRGLPLTPDALAALPAFASITFNAEESNGENFKPKVAKTGLGSSAAMTTVVVAALLHYLGVVNLSSVHHQEKDNADLDTVHVITQTDFRCHRSSIIPIETVIYEAFIFAGFCLNWFL